MPIKIEALKKAMENCYKSNSCRNCPYYDFSAECSARLIKDAYKTLEQLETENLELRKENNALRQSIAVNAITVKREGYMVFAALLKERFRALQPPARWAEKKIDTLLNELLRGKENV